MSSVSASTSNPNSLFAHTTGPRTAKVAVVGEAWGAEELAQGLPLVGASGKLFNSICKDAGFDRNDFFCTNLVNAQPPRVPGAESNDFRGFLMATKAARAAKLPELYGLYPGPEVWAGRDRLLAQLAAVRPEVVVALGNVPLWALSSNAKIRDSQKPSGWKVPAGIGDWRGSQLFIDRLPGLETPTKLLPIYHPAAVLRQWYLRPTLVHDLRTRLPLALGGRWTKPDYSAIIPRTAGEAIDWLDGLCSKIESSPTPVAVDLETRGWRVISCIGLAATTDEAMCIPFIRPTGGAVPPRWEVEEEVAITRRLRRVLCHPNCQIVGQNFAYDIQFLSKFWQIPPRLHWDTMIAQHVMFPGTPKDLGYLASMHCTDYYRYWKEDSKEWEEKGDFDSHLLYNCDDCVYTLKIFHSQRQAVAAMNLLPQVEWKLQEWHLAAAATAKGVRRDAAETGQMVLRVNDAVVARQETLQRMVPAFCRPDAGPKAAPFYSSPRQQLELLYTMLGLKSVHHRKTGNMTVNDEALEELKIRYPHLTRLLDTILELRSLRVFSSTYLQAQTDADGRLHSAFNVAGPVTMRWSSSKNAFGRGLNLQNISSGTEEDEHAS